MACLPIDPSRCELSGGVACAVPFPADPIPRSLARNPTALSILSAYRIFFFAALAVQHRDSARRRISSCVDW